MQYYSKLRDHMSTHYYLCYFFEDSGIIASEDWRLINSSLSLMEEFNAEELILTRLANHLLCGKIGLFYKMLGILQSEPDVISHDLVAEIQLVLDQNIPIGMKFLCDEFLCNT